MEITIDEAQAIVSRTDPRGEAFYRNDPSIVAAVNAAFERQHPGEMELGGLSPGTQALFEEAAGNKLSELAQGDPQTSAELPAEIQQTAQAVDVSLRAEWSGDYEANLDAAKSAALQLFGSAEAIEAFAEQTGLDRNPDLQARAVKLLAEIGRGKR